MPLRIVNNKNGKLKFEKFHLKSCPVLFSEFKTVKAQAMKKY
jgi:hypothetical protein